MVVYFAVLEVKVNLNAINNYYLAPHLKNDMIVPRSIRD